MKCPSLFLCALFLCIFVYDITTDSVTTFKQVDEDGCKNSNKICGEQKTCCMTKIGKPKCCQYTNAVCCEDMSHCCPEGTTCDTKNKRCIHQSKEPMEWTVSDDKIHAIKAIPKYTVERSPLREWYESIGLKNVCPDGGKCTGYLTCCLLTNGHYGCCPYSFGVCCPDKRTCCPNGRKCIPGSCI